MTTWAHPLASVQLDPVRSFLAEEPELRAALTQTEPWLEPLLDELRELPLAPTTGTFVSKPFYRPPGSHRCYYYCPASAGSAPGARGVLAFKGLEPQLPDLNALLGGLRRACYSPHDMAEHLIFEEQKIPACLGLNEAIREAQRAAQAQLAHLRAYGSLARLPLPLFVFRHAPATQSRAHEALRQQLSETAFSTVSPWVDAGLGAYVYYYPSAPVRARDIDTLLQGHAFRERLLALLQVCDPDELVRRWVSGFARLLWLGVLPGSLASLRTGLCCQPQNACLDGGFVDLDSLTPISSLKDDTAVYAALELSTGALLASVRSLLAGATDPSRAETLDVRIDLHHFRQFLHAALVSALEREARPSLELDPRVRSYFQAPQSFAELVGRLGSYYSPSNTRALEQARDYGEFGSWLLSVATVT